MLHDTKHDLSQDSQDLLNAADYIDQNGWCQFATKRLNGEVCLWGSLIAVTDGFDHCNPHRANHLYTITHEYLRQSPSGWNDSISRTKAEVTAFLREVAWKLKE